MTVLGEFPGSAPGIRLQVVLVPLSHGAVRIELRSQEYVEGLGWFDQRCLALDPAQMQGLVALFGVRGSVESAAFAERPEPSILPFCRMHSAEPIDVRRVDAV